MWVFQSKSIIQLIILATKDKEFAFAYLPLTTKQGTVAADVEHTLLCYSPPKSNDDPTFYIKAEGWIGLALQY